MAGKLVPAWNLVMPQAILEEVSDRVMDAASRLNIIDELADQIRQLVESKESASMLFIRQSLCGRRRTPFSSVDGM